MSDGKWIPDLTATMPLPDAARHVLTARLDLIRHYLPLALHKAYRDKEHVHQLRVATRRANAAVRIYASCLPAKVFEAAKRTLRKVRRAAGAARDWDVFHDMLTVWGKEQSDARRPGLDFLLGYAAGQRDTAQEHLADAVSDYPITFDRFLAETVAAVQRPNGRSPRRLIDLARPMLTDLLRELDLAAAADLSDYDKLHQVRIAGKRLRYAMEVFVDCFAKPFRDEIYPAVEEMQEILGRANDSHVASRHLETVRDHVRTSRPAEWKRYRACIEALLRHHQQELRRERKRFLAWWTKWRETGVEREFDKLLHAPS